MKIPQLFGRTPKHQRFSFQPRFYDADKEEREQRNRRIQLEVERGQNKTDEEYQSRIKGSFHSARKRSQATSSDLQTSLIRLMIILFLVLFVFGYIYWGNKVAYGFIVFVPAYLWIKFRK